MQSILLGGVLFMAAIQLFALGVIADLISAHRTVSQRTLERVRRLELQLGVEPSHYVPGLLARSERSRRRPRRPRSGRRRGARRAAPLPEPPLSGAAPADEASARS